MTDPKPKFARGRDGPLPVQEPGVSAGEIEFWLRGQTGTGRPLSLEDFYISRGLCPVCKGLGVCLSGWSDPVSPEEIAEAEALEVKQLPVYDLCESCGGRGQRRQ